MIDESVGLSAENQEALLEVLQRCLGERSRASGVADAATGAMTAREGTARYGVSDNTGRDVPETQITVPDPVSRAARSLADQLGISLSELYTAALSAFVGQCSGVAEEPAARKERSLAQETARRKERSLAQETARREERSLAVTQALDRVYAEQDSTIDPVLTHAQMVSCGADKW